VPLFSDPVTNVLLYSHIQMPPCIVLGLSVWRGCGRYTHIMLHVKTGFHYRHLKHCTLEVEYS